MSIGRPTLTSVELFAGGGGMALGMRRAGFIHTALVEWNHNAACVLRRNADLHPELWDVSDVQARDVRGWLDDYDGPDTVDLIAAGPPCQPFSLAGVHAGDEDERNMFPAALDAVRLLLPKIVVFENVPGLTRSSFAPYYRYVQDQLRRPMVRPRRDELWGDHHERVLTSRTPGPQYRVYEQSIDAADLGVPQNRKRIFLIGIRADLRGANDWPAIQLTHSRDALLYDQYVDSTYWGQHRLPQLDVPDRQRARVYQLKRAGRPEGERWQTLREGIAGLPKPVNRQEHPEIPNHAGIPGARAYAKHTGSPIDWPSKAIKAGVHGVCGGEAMIRFPDGALRYLTIRESARLQGFPDDYEFPVPRSRAMGIIGNAVAVDVAHEIGRALIAHCRVLAYREHR